MPRNRTQSARAWVVIAAVLATASCGRARDGEDAGAAQPGEPTGRVVPEEVTSAAAPNPGPAPGPGARGGADPGAHEAPPGPAEPGPMSAAADPPPADPHPKAADRLALRASIPENDLLLFDPVLVTVGFTNISREPLELWDFEGDVARRIAVRFRVGNDTWQFESEADPDTRAATTTLAPGQTVEIELDLLPILRETQIYGVGAMEFSLVWNGGPAGAPAGVKAWNLEPGACAVSRDLKVTVAPPEWFTKTGADADTYQQVRCELSRWTPGGPGEEDVVSRLASAGPAAIASMALLAQRLEWPGVQDDAAPSKALRMLRRLGPAVADVVRTAPASPVITLIRAYAADDAREAAKGPLPALGTEFRAVGSGDGAPVLDVTMFDAAEPEGLQLSLDADGSLWARTRVVSASPQTCRRELPPERLADVKRALNRAKPWIWRPFRGVGRPGERDVVLTLRRGTEPLWTCTLPSAEASLGNPFAADLLSALRALAAEMPGVVAAAPEPRPAEEVAR